MMRLAIAFALLATPAMAQEDIVIDQTKVYVTDPKACQALEKQGVDAFMDMEFMSLTFPGGIQSMEFHCDFYDIKTRPHTPLLFIDAVCELPGEVYADTIAIAPYDDTSIQLASSADSTLALFGQVEPQASSPYPSGTTIYHRCDNLSEIPFD